MNIKYSELEIDSSDRIKLIPDIKLAEFDKSQKINPCTTNIDTTTGFKRLQICLNLSFFESTVNKTPFRRKLPKSYLSSFDIKYKDTILFEKRGWQRNPTSIFCRFSVRGRGGGFGVKDKVLKNIIRKGFSSMKYQ